MPRNEIIECALTICGYYFICVEDWSLFAAVDAAVFECFIAQRIVIVAVKLSAVATVHLTMQRRISHCFF